MKKNLFFLFSLCFGLVLFAAVLKRIGLDNISSVVSAFSLEKFLFILIISLLGISISTLRWKIIIESQHPSKISFLKVMKTKLIGSSINYLTPVIFVGGEPVRAYLLKEETDVPLDKAAASTVIDAVIYLSVVFIFFIIGLFFLFSYFTPSTIFIFLIAIIVIFSFWLFYIFYSKALNGASGEKGFFNFFIDILGLNKIRAIRKIGQGVNSAEKNISYFFKEKKKKLIIVFSLAAFDVFFVLLTYWLVIYFLGYSVGIKQILSLNTAITLIFLVPIPAALGSFELSQAFIFPFLGISGTIGVAFSLIIRIVSLTAAFFGIIIFFHFQINSLIKKIIGKEEKLIEKFRKILDV
ncbi:flippase-like domain-containing protein [Candidatus Parcubacteria bacterium]|nr:flippase-like domain-containing protein [Candidatus Parcubacteria bacterium]